MVATLNQALLGEEYFSTLLLGGPQQPSYPEMAYKLSVKGVDVGGGGEGEGGGGEGGAGGGEGEGGGGEGEGGGGEGEGGGGEGKGGSEGGEGGGGGGEEKRRTSARLRMRFVPGSTMVT